MLMLKNVMCWLCLPLLISLNLSAAEQGAGITGVVSLSPEMALKVSPKDIVYVYAVDSKTRRITLATLRTTVRKLPLHFTLNDTLAASSERRLSGVSRVDLLARVSRNPAAARVGPDLMGEVAGIAHDSSGVELVIDTLMQCVQPGG